jgi:hypothetical protein
VHSVTQPAPQVWGIQIAQAGRVAGVLVAAALMAIAVAFAATVAGGLSAGDTPVRPSRPDPIASLTDRTPVTVTTNVGWTKTSRIVTVDAVLHDRSLWRRMRLEDWDRVPATLREPALRAMLRAYRPALSGPAAWRAMTADDWDIVPQPIRAIAYIRMIRHWSIRDRAGAELALEPRQVSPWIGAIVMVESWFEHRALNVNAYGNRDLGLAQCSDYCRAEIAALGQAGAIDWAPTEADYDNPFVATRVATLWYARELTNAAGDLELAVRAYHRGPERAWDDRGTRYLEQVRDKYERYLRVIQAPPSWAYLVAIASRTSETMAYAR